jgi:hypothetical protein
MSQDRNNTSGESGQALLCWSDAPNSPTREEFVQVLESYTSEALIKSALSVDEKTKVTLIGKDYTGIGIVKSCRKEGTNFILHIGISDLSSSAALPPDIDPGALLVDDFLTEEQETKILEGLQDASQCLVVPALVWSSLLFVAGLC